MSLRSKTGRQNAAYTLLLALWMAGLVILGALLLTPLSALQAARGSGGAALAGWDQPVWVWLEPSSKEVAMDETFTVAVKVGIAPGINGAQYRLHFDPNVLTVVDADPSRPGTQIGSAELFQKRRPNIWEASNSVDLTAGVISYAIVIVADQPVNGPGELGLITFRGKERGLSRVYFDTNPAYTGLSDYTGSSFMTTWNGGLFAVNAALQRLYLPLVLCHR